MPTLSIQEATETLATVVAKAKPSALAEIYAELYPERPSSAPPAADTIARHVRDGLAVEEVVDLWNVVFPEDHHVWYNEETKAIHYNEEMVGSAD